MITVAFKTGVKLAGLQPEMLIAIDRVASVFASYQLPLVLTSAREGGHSDHSHHYKGLAIDVRTWAIQEIIDEVIEKIKQVLGHDYQVIKEPTHIHIEYDPRTI